MGMGCLLNVISMEYEKGKNSAGFHFQPAPASTMFLVSSLTIKNTVRVNKTTVLVSSHSKINEIELFSDSYITLRILFQEFKTKVGTLYSFALQC